MKFGALQILLAGLVVFTGEAFSKDLTDFTNAQPSAADIRRALTPEEAPKQRFRGIQVDSVRIEPVEDPKAVALSVTFDFDSDALTDEALVTLEQLGLALVSFEGNLFRIEGHTDTVGSDDYNVSLSLRRAVAVRNYLTREFSIDSRSLLVDGRGESELLDPSNPEGGANRRVEIVNLATVGETQGEKQASLSPTLPSTAEAPAANDLVTSVGEQIAAKPSPAERKPSPRATEDLAQIGLKLLGSGTGFFVTASGHALTNHHVVRGCERVRVAVDGRSLDAQHRTSDIENDLALLDIGQAVEAFAKFRDGPPIRRADEVAAIGYPLRGTGLASDQLSVTDGIVSALTGPGRKLTLMQITAPLQPGNSGGPLLDGSGNVVGIVVGKANADKVAEISGQLPENVNFAIKSLVAQNFLNALGVKYETGKSETVVALPDISERAQNFTVAVECWG